MAAVVDATPRVDIFADVWGWPSVSLGAVAAEFSHWPLLIRLIRAIDRVAIMADAQWVRTLNRIEGALVPRSIAKLCAR